MGQPAITMSLSGFTAHWDGPAAWSVWGFVAVGAAIVPFLLGGTWLLLLSSPLDLAGMVLLVFGTCVWVILGIIWVMAARRMFPLIGSVDLSASLTHLWVTHRCSPDTPHELPVDGLVIVEEDEALRLTVDGRTLTLPCRGGAARTALLQAIADLPGHASDPGSHTDIPVALQDLRPQQGGP